MTSSNIGISQIGCEETARKHAADTEDMLQWLKEREITGMSVVPSHLRSMAQGDVSRTAERGWRGRSGSVLLFFAIHECVYIYNYIYICVYYVYIFYTNQLDEIN